MTLAVVMGVPSHEQRNTLRTKLYRVDLATQSNLISGQDMALTPFLWHPTDLLPLSPAHFQSLLALFAQHSSNLHLADFGLRPLSSIPRSTAVALRSLEIFPTYQEIISNWFSLALVLLRHQLNQVQVCRC